MYAKCIFAKIVKKKMKIGQHTIFYNIFPNRFICRGSGGFGRGPVVAAGHAEPSARANSDLQKLKTF